MKKILAILLVLVLVAGLVACATPDTPAPATPAPATPAPPANGGGDDPDPDPPSGERLNVVLLAAQFGDRSFNDSAMHGMQRLNAELGDYVYASWSEIGNDNAHWGSAVLEAAEQGPDIIVVGTWAMVEPARVAAAAFPDIQFLLLDDEIADMPNVHSFMFHVNEGSFLVGMLAAEVTETDIIGFVGGMDATPVIWDFLIGYILGAQYVNPDIQVVVSYTNDFRDAPLAYELATAQINNSNADVLFSVAGGAGAGTIEAAAENGIFVIGVDSDQAAQYEGRPEHEWIISSSMKRVGDAIFERVAQVVAGETLTGHVFLGMAEGTVGWVVDDNTRRVVDQAFIDRVNAVAAEIAAGTRTVPSAWALTPEATLEIINSAS
ncbi:MAG: BMP family ABC transporter substrate-binding protein [Oscillospiraceae bacterium]|nr:BMP family ABC transporter substrate-binding protein [Oscillospiraceae bacterium]